VLDPAMLQQQWKLKIQAAVSAMPGNAAAACMLSSVAFRSHSVRSRPVVNDPQQPLLRALPQTTLTTSTATTVGARADRAVPTWLLTAYSTACTRRGRHTIILLYRAMPHTASKQQQCSACIGWIAAAAAAAAGTPALHPHSTQIALAHSNTRIPHYQQPHRPLWQAATQGTMQAAQHVCKCYWISFVTSTPSCNKSSLPARLLCYTLVKHNEATAVLLPAPPRTAC
jgi:hypothetical protein